MKIKKLKGHELEGEKRQRIPFVLTSHCPCCGIEKQKNLIDDYLMNPVFGEPTYVSFACNVCDEDWAEWIVVDFTCRVAE